MRTSNVAIIAIVVLIGLGGCEAREAAPAVAPLTLTAHGLGPVPFCVSLDSIDPALGAFAVGKSRDTTFVGEDSSHWPGRAATLASGGTVAFESSWLDTVRVWRISTDAPSVRTAHGASVGTAIEQLAAASGPVGLQLLEGQPVLSLAGDSVGALVDTAAERALVDARERGGRAPVVPPGARLRSLVAAGHCRVPASGR